ncbi:hypothetical protein Hanom_Chr10g00954981 [Helianthus anomalus]
MTTTPQLISCHFIAQNAGSFFDAVSHVRFMFGNSTYLTTMTVLAYNGFSLCLNLQEPLLSS